MITSTDAINLRRRVTDRLAEFQIKVELPIHTDIYQAAGLAVMRFKPLAGAAQKVDAILGRENEMALAAGVVPRMYLDAPTNSVVAEFLLAKPPTLLMSALMDSGIAYGMTLGRDVQGQPLHLSIDNDATPHALVVGTTGSGKTALCHSMVATIARSTPRLKLLTYDPAHADFPWLMPFIKGNLIEAVSESSRLLVRLNQMVDLIASGRDVPGRVLIYIDELRDLIQAEPRIVEPLTRIAQRGRQAGIHLLCATQNPSRKSMPPDLIKNMPARVVLAVVDRAESDMASGNVKIDAHKLPRPGAGVMVANGQAVRFIAAIPDNYATAQTRGLADVRSDAPDQEPLPIVLRKPAPNRLEAQARREFALPAIASPKGETMPAQIMASMNGSFEALITPAVPDPNRVPRGLSGIIHPAHSQTIEAVPVAMTRPADSYTLAERIALVMAWNPSVSVSALQNALRPGGAQNGFATVTQIVNEIRSKRGEE